jgi:hypothetical protein
MGVRGDPRLGFHSADLLFSPNGANTLTNVTNPYSTLGSINNDKWKIGEFDGKLLSPDITPPEVFFAQDRGFLYSVFDNHPPDGESFYSSGELGQFPITTFKSGHHLAWSTPRFWGDGRTNMGDNQVYPPDWLMLDCVHTSMFPQNTNRIFTSYATNSFVSYGRLNINGLKSFFQIPRGSSDRSDTTLDSLVIQARTKDFRDWDESIPNVNGSRDWKRILPSHANRTNLLNYINDEVVRRGSVNNPFLTGFDFTAQIAGNTNSALTNVSDWQFYNPNETNFTNSTTDYRIESMVRSLQQRVTSRGFQFSVFSLGQSVQVVQSGSTYKTNVIGESYFQAVWERAPKHNLDGTISNASSGGAPPLRLLYMRELR